MRYVPARYADAASPSTAARRALRELRVEAERRAWARGRPRPQPGPQPAGADGAPDRLGGLMAELRAATTRYVCAVRAEGARPEQMLVGVKAFVREAMAAEHWHDPDAVQALTDKVVGWSIAAYYDR